MKTFDLYYNQQVQREITWESLIKYCALNRCPDNTPAKNSSEEEWRTLEELRRNRVQEIEFERDLPSPVETIQASTPQPYRGLWIALHAIIVLTCIGGFCGFIIPLYLGLYVVSFVSLVSSGITFFMWMICRVVLIAARQVDELYRR